MKRLIEIQSALKAPKNQRNSFGNYNYRSCEDILEAVKPLLKKQGLALIIKDDIAATEGRFYVKATATIYDEEGKEIASSCAFAREDESKRGMDASQLTGATSSYARKYALNGLFAIDDTKDSDATNTHGKEGKEEKPKLPPKKGRPTVSGKDLEFYEVIAGFETVEDLKEYYLSTKELVDDREAYHQLVVDRQKAIKEGK